MISDLQFLSFEIAPTCNMSNKHPWCPVNDPLRYPKHERHTPCSDQAIVNFAVELHKRGFNGYVGFHYYCDPLVDIKRMLRLIEALKSQAPFKFILWTNGRLLTEACLNWIPEFSRIEITKHDAADIPRLQQLTHGYIQIHFHEESHDDRLQVYDNTVTNKGGCVRPSTIELPVNYYGQVRLCCTDYRGTVSIGNIQTEQVQEIIKNWEDTAESVRNGLVPLCWQCRGLGWNTVVL